MSFNQRQKQYKNNFDFKNAISLQLERKKNKSTNSMKSS